MKHRSKRSWMATSLATLAILSVACGSPANVSDQATGTTATTDTVEPDPVLDSPIVVPAADEPSPEYGATLEEWNGFDQSAAAVQENSNDYAFNYPEISWDDLIPAGFSGDDIYDRFEERLAALEYGSDEVNALYREMDAEFDPDIVNPELDGEQIRLVGFVAPLTYEGEIVTEFLLVPNFGACIHVPPPPANQTVMVSSDVSNGLTVEESWGVVWVEGTIVVEAGTADIGASGYRITDIATGPYTDF